MSYVRCDERLLLLRPTVSERQETHKLFQGTAVGVAQELAARSLRLFCGVRFKSVRLAAPEAPLTIGARLTPHVAYVKGRGG